MPSLTQMNKKQLIEEAKTLGIFIKDPKMKRKELIEVIRLNKDPMIVKIDAIPPQTVTIQSSTDTAATSGYIQVMDMKLNPKMGEEGWTDYVLGLLRKDEMQDGNPTLFGLRRIAQQLISRIVECRTLVKQIPNPTNNFTATVVVEVTFTNYGGGKGGLWSGAADVSPANCMEEYAKHPTATAESRAEGRALRKALGINVHTVDEVGISPVDVNDDGLISSNQVSSIDMMATTRLHISVPALLSNLGITDRATDELTVKEGIQVLGALQEFFNNPENIPEEIKND